LELGDLAIAVGTRGLIAGVIVSILCVTRSTSDT
jgi:hypothetical protein